MAWRPGPAGSPLVQLVGSHGLMCFPFIWMMHGLFFMPHPDGGMPEGLDGVGVAAKDFLNVASYALDME